MAELQSCTAHACIKQQQPQNASDCPCSQTVQSNTDNGIRGNATCLVMRQHTKQYHSRRNTKQSRPLGPLHGTHSDRPLVRMMQVLEH